MNLADPTYMIASLIWSAVGLGFFVYGKKESSGVPMVGGLLIIGMSYIMPSILAMFLSGAAVSAAMLYLLRRGY